MDISTRGTRGTKQAKDLVIGWPMTASKAKAGEEGVRNRKTKTVTSAHEKYFKFTKALTWRISRLRLSRILGLIPPVVRLARQSNLKTIWRSAPWAMRSSIAVNCEETLYEARRSV